MIPVLHPQASSLAEPPQDLDSAVGAVQDNHGPCADMLAYILRQHGLRYDSDELMESLGAEGCPIDLTTFALIADSFGLTSHVARWNVSQLKDEVTPCVLSLAGRLVILTRVTTRYHFYDPTLGSYSIDLREFLARWRPPAKGGAVLFLRPGVSSVPRDGDEQGIPSTDNVTLTRWKAFQSFARLLSPYKGLLIQSFVIHIAISLLGLFAAFSTQGVIDLGVGLFNISLVVALCLAIVVLKLSRMLSQFSQRWVMFYLGSRINTSLSSFFVKRLTNIPAEYLFDKTPGDILERNRDALRIREFFVGGAIGTLQSSVTFFGFSIVLLYYSFSIYAIFLVGSLFSTTFTLMLGNSRRKLDTLMFAVRAKKNDQLNQLTRGYLDVRSGELADPLTADWEQVHWEWEGLQKREIRLDQLEKGVTTTVNEIKDASVLCVCAIGVITGEMTIGMLFAVSFLVGQLNAPITKLAHLVRSIEQTYLSFQRISEIVQSPKESVALGFRGVHSSPPCDPPQETLWVRDLTYRYAGNECAPALNDVSIDFSTKSFTAIIGPSGCGKSTLSLLLLGLLRVQQGQMGFGSCEYTRWGIQKWRREFAACLQHARLFRGSLLENITGFSQHPDMRRFEECVHMACLEEVIRDLPRSVDTFLDSDSQALSGGQSQRVGLARALYRKSSVLVLDEATCALDYATEQRVIGNIRQNTNCRVIAITHRVESITDADAIVVMDRGAIIGHGTHEELLDDCNAYRDQLSKSASND